jgi:hypothetical protein
MQRICKAEKMTTFDQIYQREFTPMNVPAALGNINLYSGDERMRQFELASYLIMVQAGGTMHPMTRLTTANRINSDLANNISVVTFASNRILANKDNPYGQASDAPFFLYRKERRGACGLRVNSEAHVEYQYDQRAWISKNQQAIDIALTNGADVVCLGEFDFPPHDIDGAIIGARESFALNMRHRRWIRTRLQQHGKPALVFAGSSHEWSSHDCANMGEIFISDCGDDGKLLIRYQRYEKRIAAKGLGELLRSVTRPLSYFGTSIARIAVLICVDAFDPGVSLAMFAGSQGADRIDMILVPSYNPSRRLVYSCQQLSYLANCVVVYVNAMATAPHEKAEVFLSGIPLRTWRSQLSNIVDMITSRTRPDLRTGLGHTSNRSPAPRNGYWKMPSRDSGPNCARPLLRLLKSSARDAADLR